MPRYREKYQEFLQESDEEKMVRDRVLKPGEIHLRHLAHDARPVAASSQVTTVRDWFFFILGS